MPSTTAKWISFPNHKNRKLVKGRNNVLVNYVNASAPNPSSAAHCNSFKWDILCFISDWKLCYFCVCNNSEMNFIPQPQEQKSCGRQTQCSSTICGCFCTWPIWCCPVLPFYLRYLVVHLFLIKNCMVQNTYISLFKHTTR